MNKKKTGHRRSFSVIYKTIKILLSLTTISEDTYACSLYCNYGSVPIISRRYKSAALRLIHGFEDPAVLDALCALSAPLCAEFFATIL